MQTYILNYVKRILIVVWSGSCCYLPEQNIVWSSLSGPGTAHGTMRHTITEKHKPYCTKLLKDCLVWQGCTLKMWRSNTMSLLWTGLKLQAKTLAGTNNMYRQQHKSRDCKVPRRWKRSSKRQQPRAVWFHSCDSLLCVHQLQKWRIHRKKRHDKYHQHWWEKFNPESGLLMCLNVEGFTALFHRDLRRFYVPLFTLRLEWDHWKCLFHTAGLSKYICSRNKGL